MRKYVFVLAFLAPTLIAQEASITTPITQPSIAKYRVNSYVLTRSPNRVVISIAAQDSGDVDLPSKDFVVAIPSTSGVGGATCTTTISGLAGAQNVTVSGETGSEGRKWQARVLGYLNTQGCLGAGVTLIP